MDFMSEESYHLRYVPFVLDKISEEDHSFGKTIFNQTKEYFPHQIFKEVYEPLPKDPMVLNFPGQHREPDYNR